MEQSFEAISFESHPLLLPGVFVLMALTPFFVLGLTSFLKLSVVFGILRNAIGAGQIPSAAVTGLLSLVLTLHIMAPVGQEMLHHVSQHGEKFAAETVSFRDLMIVLGEAKAPLEEFLKKHSSARERKFFARSGEDTFLSLIPAFVISELEEAFAIGFSLFLPFLVIDIVVANILVGLGMLMVSPLSIALPFKIVLFVLCDGWFLLSRGLLLGYQ